MLKLNMFVSFPSEAKKKNIQKEVEDQCICKSGVLPSLLKEIKVTKIC